MHWEVHITEFEMIGKQVEPNEKAHSVSVYRLIDYKRARMEFLKICDAMSNTGIRVFRNGLTLVAVTSLYETNQWCMIALTLEKGWA